MLERQIEKYLVKKIKDKNKKTSTRVSWTQSRSYTIKTII